MKTSGSFELRVTVACAVVANTTDFPSGENDPFCNCRTCAPKLVSRRNPVPSGRTTKRLPWWLKSGPFALLRTRISVPSGDQSGWSPARRVHGVTRRRPVPSRLTTNVACPFFGFALMFWRSNTRRLPSGENCGRPAPARLLPGTTTRRLPPSLFITRIEKSSPWLACLWHSKAIWEPSGENDGELSSRHRPRAGLSRFAPLPSEDTVQSVHGPSTDGPRWNTIRLPSADQSGWSSIRPRGARVILRSPLPSALAMKMSACNGWS